MEIKPALLAPHPLQTPFREGVFQTFPTALSVGSKSPKALRTQEYFYTLILAAKPALRLFIDLVDPRVNSHTFGY